jgi:hypothetical protein
MKGNTWEIFRKEDGTFEMFHQGKLVRGAIPDPWLEDELARYGLCGEEYHDIRRQLDESGKAKIAL